MDFNGFCLFYIANTVSTEVNLKADEEFHMQMIYELNQRLNIRKNQVTSGHCGGVELLTYVHFR